MANICDFQMVVKGKEEDIISFINAMQQEGKYCMGRGGNIEYYGDGKIDGWCKWSISTAMVLNALSMRKQKETGIGHWDNSDNFIEDYEFITLFEASKMWNLEVEAVSWEEGCGFSEYYHIKDGEVLEEGGLEYSCEYNEDADEYRDVGGYDCLF